MAAPQAPASGQPAPTQPAPSPVLPLDIIDASTQRLYAITVFSLLQTYKLLHWAEASLGTFLPWRPTVPSAGPSLFNTRFLLYSVLDVGLLFLIYRLRIPRLDWSRATVTSAAMLLVLGDYLLLGAWTISGLLHVVTPASVAGIWERQLAIDEISVRPDTLVRAIDHILGSFTLDVLPYATARLDAEASRPCFQHLLPGAFVTVPLLLNNTLRPSYVSYSIADFVTGERTFFELEKQELASMQSASKALTHEISGEEVIEEEWRRLTSDKPLTRPAAASTASLSLRINKTGVLRLERVLDANREDVDVMRGTALPVTQCPLLSWDISRETTEHGCSGETTARDAIVNGVPPLSIKYSRRRTKHHVETFSMTGLVGPAKVVAPSGGDGTYAWGAAQSIAVPIRADFSFNGLYEYRLEEIKDALGHIHRPSQSSHAVRYVYGHTSAEAHLVEEGSIGLLRGGQTPLTIRVRGGRDQKWKATLRHEPPEGQSGRSERQLDLQVGDNTQSLGRPGTYTLTRLEGQYCPGSIGGQNTVAVNLLPEPTLTANFVPIQDECAGAVGIRASLVFTGRPPYTVTYSTKRHGGHDEISRQTVNGERGEIVFQPREYGQYTLALMRIDDANYRGIDVAGSSTADVRPLASARFSQTKRRIYSCQGDSIDASIKLTGEAPFKLQVDVLAPAYRKTLDLSASSNEISTSLTIPPSISKQGGSFTASIVNIVDGRGCRRSLSAPDLRIEVDRDVPTARFNPAHAGAIILKAGSSVALPLALTGDSPWQVRYRLVQQGGEAQTLETTVRDRNAALSVSKPGDYQLVSVADAHCPGKVSDEAAKLSVAELPKPTFGVSQPSPSSNSRGSKSHRRVCQGRKESVNLELVGTPPFVVHYEVKHRGTSKRSSITAADYAAELLLNTSLPGRHTIDFSGVTDSLYPEVLPIAGLSKVQLDVLPLPEISFGKTTSIGLCVGETLSALKASDRQLALSTTGAKPFDLSLHLIEPNRGALHRLQAKDVTASSWFDSIDYVFERPGRFDLAVAEVSDANGCLQAYDAGSAPRLVIDVAATASITATDEAIDHCVGDNISYLLGGTAPWTVSYSWTAENGRTDEKTVSVHEPTFARLASAPGTYRIRSVGHRDSTCRSSSDLVKRIHPIPSVRVQTGSRSHEAIHTGEQKEIVFHLTGTPPFTFTWTRSALAAGSKKPEVIEKHTVSDVYEHAYSIYTSSAGTFAVEAIADGTGCAYPPSHSRKMIEI